MKNGGFIRKISLFLAPFVLYAGLFVAYEPYNYWGIKPVADYRTTAFARLLAYKRNPNENIVLGDSRFANLNRSAMTDATEENYFLLGYGGQNLPEQIDSFWYAADQQQLTHVVMGISFTRFVSLNANRVHPLFAYLDNPEQYITSFLYHRDMLQNLWEHIKPLDEAPPAQPDFQGYAQIIYNAHLNWEFQEEYLTALIDIAQYCAENNIELRFVTPPLHPTIWENVIDPLELAPAMDYYKETLSMYAPVYDMEYRECLFTTQYADAFSDGYHLGSNTTFEKYTQSVFADESPFFRIWADGNLQH